MNVFRKWAEDARYRKAVADVRAAMIHWYAKDARTGELVNWGTGSNLEVVIAQILDTDREYDGHLIFRRVDEALETTRDLTGETQPTYQERQINRVRRAARDLATAIDKARQCASDDELAAAIGDRLGGVLDVIQPDRPASL